jgi:hypothetical protein
MAKTTGRMKITAAGKFADTFKGVTFDPGGIKRTSVPTAHSNHFSEETVGSKLEFDRAFIAGSSIKDFDLSGEQVTVELDTGQTYVIASMFRTDPEVLGDEGKGKIVLEGDAAKEMQ